MLTVTEEVGMLQDVADALNIPVAAVVVLGIVVIVQIGLQLYSLIDLARRQHVTWEKKWLWALIILFVSSGIGAILYLAVGRQAPPAPETSAAPESDPAATDRAREAVDLLYGPRDGETSR